MNPAGRLPRFGSRRSLMRHATTVGLTVALAVALGAVLARTGLAQTAGPSLKVMSYNIHHGEGTDRVLDLNRIAAIILAADPDVVALQEVDRHTNRSGGVDQAAVLAGLTNMQHHFGKTDDHDGGEVGNAILTKHFHTLIADWPLPGFKEGRAALFVEVDLSDLYGPGVSITVVGTHLDHKKSANRIQSARDIETVMTGIPRRPALLAGDLNDRPGTQTLGEFELYWEREDLGQAWWTFPASTPDRQLDYVLHRRAGDWTVRSIEVINEPVASDHRPIVYELAINPVPTAQFTESCASLTCAFTDASYDPDGTMIAWSWDFGDTSTASVPNPVHEYSEAGNYTVSLTVTDDDQNTDTTVHTVTVSTGPAQDLVLETAGYKTKGLMEADLSWTGGTSTNVDVYRNGDLIGTTANDGSYADHINERGSGSFTYRVCEETTHNCSNESSVEF